MSNPILLNERTAGTKVSQEKLVASALRLGRWLAVGLIVASLLDLGALWYPIRLGSMEWEYSTIATTFDSLPLVTMGLGFLAAVAMIQGRRGAQVVFGAIFVVLAVKVAVLLVIFGLDVPVAIQASPLDARSLVKEASVKAALTGVTYAVLYIGAAFTLLRRRDG